MEKKVWDSLFGAHNWIEKEENKKVRDEMWCLCLAENRKKEVLRFYVTAEIEVTLGLLANGFHSPIYFFLIFIIIEFFNLTKLIFI